jgi:hypothetical protein
VIEVGVDRHRFAHALVRETLHAELSSSRRARQHRKVAAAIEARHRDDIDSVISELATHWLEASAGGDPTRAVELAIRAGDLAAERNAAENSVRWYERVLEVLDDDDDLLPEVRRRTLVKLAECQVLVGATVAARTNALRAARAAIGVNDAATATSAIAVRTRNSFDSTDPADPERVGVLRTVLEMDLNDAQRATVLGALATELIFERDIDGRQAALDEWKAITDSYSAQEWWAVGGSPGTASRRYPLSSGIRDAGRLRTLVEAEPTGSGRLWPTVGWWFAASRIADRAAMDLAVVRMREAQADLGIFAAMTHMPECMHLTLDGHLGEAFEARTKLLKAMHELNIPEVAVYDTTTGMALGRELGTLAELGWLAGVMEAMGHNASAARSLAAYIRLIEGDHDRVWTALALVEDERFADDAGYDVVVAMWSEIVAALRSARHCQRLLDELAPLDGTQLGSGGMHFGSAARLMALLHDVLGADDAHVERLFAQAVREHEALQSPPWIARTHLDWADVLVRRGRINEVEPHLDAARAAIGTLALPDLQHRLTDRASHPR